MFKQRSADVHSFAMVPRAEVPRSAFRMQESLKTTFDAGYLIPIMCKEILPGDAFNVKATFFARMATPIFPVMDNLWFETFFFFVPMRLLWTNFQKFMGEQVNPGDSISYVIPQIVSPAGGHVVGGIYDMFGLPTVGQIGGGATISHNALPLRAYNMIWTQWFRDENLQNSAYSQLDDGPDPHSGYFLRRRGKRHDYFTSCLPNPQKGGAAVSLPLGSTAPVIPTGDRQPLFRAEGVNRGILSKTIGTTDLQASGAVWAAAGVPLTWSSVDSDTKLVANLAGATAATINQIREAFQIQRFLERDARGGTRYTEIVLSHFGVRSPDARLQRPEYLGGGKTPVIMNPVAKTSTTDATSPQGNLAAMATMVAHEHGFSQSFTEHGYVIGLCQVNADLSYQQGIEKLWSRSTRYDFYWPVFSHLGEQAVLNREIYADGSANDALVFGYQERYGEYRYGRSKICGYFRSTVATPIDAWHLAQDFATLPTLNDTFIQDTPPVSRVVAVGSGANGQQFLLDGFFDIRAARPMPMYGVPGMVDHF